MLHPEGGSIPRRTPSRFTRGKSYLWTRAQIEAVLGAERSEQFLSVYRLAPMPEGEGLALRVALPIEPALERLSKIKDAKKAAKNAAELLQLFDADRQKLLDARSARNSLCGTTRSWPRGTG